MIAEVYGHLARSFLALCVAVAITTLSACGGSGPAQSFSNRDAFIVEGASSFAFQQPQPRLGAPELALFAQGKEEFERRWVPFPSIGGQWGRGPLSNARSCAQCHERNGRTPAGEDPMALMVVRLAVPDIHGKPTPHPIYGRQLSTQGILGRVPAEGQVRLRWHEHRVVLHDGEVIWLRYAEPQLYDLAHGPLSGDTRTSLRIAPRLVGLGLLETIDEREFDRLRAHQRSLGYEGHVPRVWDHRSQTWVRGRFSWKASQPSLRQQAATAFLEDIGVTSSLFPTENCSPVQTACAATETVAHPELKDEQLDNLTAYLQGLAVPAPRKSSAKGARLFSQLHCDACHASELRTSLASAAVISPYTDLMLHDMGEALADQLGEFEAKANEWRTPPLWGLGLMGTEVGLLHDGRARDAQEAILWHGGHARESRDAFARLSRTDRVILLQFLQSL